MTNTPSIAETPAVEVPPRAKDALRMADRVVRVAAELHGLGIKPRSIQVSLTYLWGLPDSPYAPDGLSVQVDAADFLRLVDEWHLSRDDEQEGNVYASGIVSGVAVLLFTGRAGLEAVSS